MSIYPPTGTLEIKDATLKIAVIDLQYTSNTAKIEANSNVVTEFSRSKKLIKYPRVALTANSSGGYTVTVSSTRPVSSGNSYYGYQAFDTIKSVSYASPNSYGWVPETNSNYNSSGNIYNPSVDTPTRNLGSGAVDGEWIKLELPNRIRLEHMKLAHDQTNDPSRAPEDFLIYGSNDNVNWTELLSVTNANYVGSSSTIAGYTSHDVKTTTFYQYFGVVVTKISGQPNYFRVFELEYFGIPEYDPEADGVDVTVKSLPNVPNTDWLEVYYDAKDLADAAVTSVNDLKPSSLGSAINSSSVTNVTVSDEAFVFNGSSSGINATLSNPQGPWVHSVSVWVKLGKDHSDYTGDNVFSFGNVAGTAQLESLRIHANDVRLITFQGGADPNYSLPMDRDRWYHFTLTYNGGAATNSFKLFRDGLESTGTTTATPVALNVAANSLLSIGYERVRNTSHFNGSIANFRIFNRALSSDEIYQLYAYQKEYFGHGVLGMTLKAGNLHIDGFVGTSRTGGLIIPSGTTAQLPTGVTGMIRFNTQVNKVQVHNGSIWTTIGNTSATGGTISNADGYRIHTFTSESGTLVVNSGGQINILIVAGGGGGGGLNGAAGAGAGGLIELYDYVIDAGSYDITIGGGGARAVGGGLATNGSNSTFGTLYTALGGGYGATQSRNPDEGGAGGSGGGGAGAGGTPGGPGALGGASTQTPTPPGYGNAGGTGRYEHIKDAGGGGGGAGGAGGNGSTNAGGNGGNGRSFFGTIYAGGGGGGSYNGTSGTGGTGGGGGGGNANTNGTNGTGGMGGGGGGGTTGGNGGSGIVIIRYLS